MVEIAMLKYLKNEGLISQKEFDDAYTLLLKQIKEQECINQ